MMSGSVAACEGGAVATSILWVVARDAAKHPAMHRTVCPSQRIIWMKMLTVLRKFAQ